MSRKKLEFWQGKENSRTPETAFAAQFSTIPDRKYPTFRGTAIPFGPINDRYQIIAQNAFDGSEPDFLKHGIICGLNHNDWDPVGVPLEFEVTKTGISLVAEITAETPEGKRVVDLISPKASNGRAIVTGLSARVEVQGRQLMITEKEVRDYWSEIKYTPTQHDLNELAEAMKPYEGYVFGIRLLTKLKPKEVSPCCFPAFWGARIDQGEAEEAEGTKKFSGRLQLAKLQAQALGLKRRMWA